MSEIESNFGQEFLEKKELSLEFVEKVEKSKIDIEQKVNLLLTVGGLKPSSEITLLIKELSGGQEHRYMTEEDVQESISIIKESGLPPDCLDIRGKKEKSYEYEGYEYKNSDHKILKPTGRKEVRSVEYVNILIGRIKEELERLSKILAATGYEQGSYAVPLTSGKHKEISEDKNYHKELGLAVGISPTAVEAYIGDRKQFDIITLLKDYTKALFFSTAILSEDNWQEELKQGRKYADFIESVSPAIYNEFVDIRKKDLEQMFKDLKNK